MEIRCLVDANIKLKASEKEKYLWYSEVGCPFHIVLCDMTKCCLVSFANDIWSAKQLGAVHKAVNFT